MNPGDYDETDRPHHPRCPYGTPGFEDEGGCYCSELAKIDRRVDQALRGARGDVQPRQKGDPLWDEINTMLDSLPEDPLWDEIYAILDSLLETARAGRDGRRAALGSRAEKDRE